MRTILFPFVAFTVSVSLHAAPICQDVQGSLIYDSSTTLGKSTVIVNPRMKTAQGEAHIFIGSTGNVVSLNSIREGLCQALKFDIGLSITELRNAHKGDPLADFNANGTFIGLHQAADDTYEYVQTITCFKY